MHHALRYKHTSVLEVANLILVVGGDATAHDVRQRHVCKQCNTRGENTFKVIFKGGWGVVISLTK